MNAFIVRHQDKLRRYCRNRVRRASHAHVSHYHPQQPFSSVAEINSYPGPLVHADLRKVKYYSPAIFALVGCYWRAAVWTVEHCSPFRGGAPLPPLFPWVYAFDTFDLSRCNSTLLYFYIAVLMSQTTARGSPSAPRARSRRPCRSLPLGVPCKCLVSIC